MESTKSAGANGRLQYNPRHRTIGNPFETGSWWSYLSIPRLFMPGWSQKEGDIVYQSTLSLPASSRKQATREVNQLCVVDLRLAHEALVMRLISMASSLHAHETPVRLAVCHKKNYPSIIAASCPDVPEDRRLLLPRHQLPQLAAHPQPQSSVGLPVFLPSRRVVSFHIPG